MAKLIFSLDNTILNEFQLDKGRISVGRRPTNDIHIDNLAVSGEHAVILKKGDDFYVEDLSSTNGTHVNDKMVKSHLLQAGDLIEFGKYQLKYVNEDALQGDGGSEAAFEKTIMIRPSAMKVTASAPIAPETQVATAETSTIASDATFIAVGRIQVLNGSSAGRELVLNKALTTLGKTGVQVAVITKRPNGYFITHVEGKVFPIINGTSTGTQAFALSDHDVVELAGVKMEFYLDNV